MEQQKLKEKKAYENESIEDLLLLLSYGDQYPDEFTNAFIEFHRRYNEIIYKICNRSCKFFDNSVELATDLANNVLLIACQDAINLRIPNGLKESEKEEILLEWFVALAKEELKIFTLHNPDRKKYLQLDTLPLIEDEAPENLDEEALVPTNDYNYPITIESVTEVLSSLKPRDKEVVLAYLTHVERKNAHLPDEIMEGLCLKYDTTSFNIRQIKKRVFDKIRKLSENKSKP